MMDNDVCVINPEYNDIISKINRPGQRKIIITGEKQSGKSEVLRYYTKNYSRTAKKILYTDYKNFNYKANLSESEYNLYYELIFVKKMLDSIIVYSPKLYSNLKMFDAYIDKQLNKMKEFLMIRFCPRDDISFEKGSLVKRMIEIFKLYGVTNINLIIDHFDFVGESSERFQIFMEEYFKYFNRVIITTNEKINDDKKERLAEKKYVFIDANVGISKNIVKKILCLYLNEIRNNSNDIEYLKRVKNLERIMKDENFYLKLINECNCNIDMMKQVIRCYIMGNSIEESIKSSVRLETELEHLTYKRTLHL